MATFLIDFDGTCVPSLQDGYSWDDIGSEKVLKELVQKGHKIVLCTARNDSPDNPYNYTRGVLRKETSLQEAIRWFMEREIPLYGINENPDQKEIVGTSRKILGDYLIDDISLGIPTIYTNINYTKYDGTSATSDTYFVDWTKIKRILKQKNLI